jgi:hypothetical protein
MKTKTQRQRERALLREEEQRAVIYRTPEERLETVLASRSRKRGIPQPIPDVLEGLASSTEPISSEDELRDTLRRVLAEDRKRTKRDGNRLPTEIATKLQHWLDRLDAGDWDGAEEIANDYEILGWLAPERLPRYVGTVLDPLEILVAREERRELRSSQERLTAQMRLWEIYLDITASPLTAEEVAAMSFEEKLRLILALTIGPVIDARIQEMRASGELFREIIEADSQNRAEFERRMRAIEELRAPTCACGCGEALTGRKRKYLNKRHADCARKRAQRARTRDQGALRG